MSNERAEPARSLAASPMYGRRAAPRDSPAERAPYAGETYYGGPVVKAGHWRRLIITYYWVGGIAGAAQVVATAADLAGRERDREIVRSGRYLALGGVLVSPVLLIADLHKPARWYNMLRIVRPTSPMSLGSWALTAFGGLSGLAAVCQAADDLMGLPGARRAATVFGIPTAALGGIVAVYTGALTTATSVPLWAAAPRLLTALFGASASATALASLSLSVDVLDAPEGSRRRLEALALAVGAVELGLAVATLGAWRRRGVSAPLDAQPLKTVYRAGVLGLGVCAPLAVHVAHALTRRRSRRASLFADTATLAGGLLLRTVVVLGGHESAARPQDYFVLTQPEAGAPWDQASEVEDGEAAR